MANRKIGALWQRKSQDGKTFLSGVLQDLGGDIQIAVFRNDRKEADNQPDFNIVLSEPKEKREKTDNDDFLAPGSDKAEDTEEVKVDNIPW